MNTFNILSAVLALVAQYALCASIPTHPRGDHTSAVLTMVNELFPASIAIGAAQGVVSAGTQTLGQAMGFQMTHVDVDAGMCKDVIMVFARGTFEPGNVGSLVGPELFGAVSHAMHPWKTMAIQGVDSYPATMPEYLVGGSPEGSTAMAAAVTMASVQCPHSAIVMSGYSQGAQLVHNAADQLGPVGMSRVNAVVTFGDPDSTRPLTGYDPSKHMVVCHDGDDICQFGGMIQMQHLTYAADAQAAASFIVSNL